MNKKEMDKAIGKLIRERREIRGMFQRELAEKLDVTRPVVSDIESGKQSLSIYRWYRIAVILDIYPQFLLPFDVWLIE